MNNCIPKPFCITVVTLEKLELLQIVFIWMNVVTRPSSSCTLKVLHASQFISSIENLRSTEESSVWSKCVDTSLGQCIRLQEWYASVNHLRVARADGRTQKLIEELRPVLGGFVATMHEGAWIMTFCLHKPGCIVTTKADWPLSRLQHDIFILSHREYYPLNSRMWFSKQALFRALLRLVRHLAPRNNRSCPSQWLSSRNDVLVTRYRIPV